jgi:hypothetical protein
MVIAESVVMRAYNARLAPTGDERILLVLCAAAVASRSWLFQILQRAVTV